MGQINGSSDNNQNVNTSGDWGSINHMIHNILGDGFKGILGGASGSLEGIQNSVLYGVYDPKHKN
jgi:hypothetical protein